MWRRKQAHEKPPFKIYFSPSDEKLISCSSAGHKVQQSKLLIAHSKTSEVTCLRYRIGTVSGAVMCAMHTIEWVCRATYTPESI